MRLCRYRAGEWDWLGLYLGEDRIIPLGDARLAYEEDTGGSLDFPLGEDPVAALTEHHGPLEALWAWVQGLVPDHRESLVLEPGAAKLLVPIRTPPKILLLAGNYAKHIEERGYIAAERAETFPYVFLKPPTTTLTNPGDPIRLPASSPDHIDWECELGVVIGRGGRDIAEVDALGHVAGYTVVNDISDRKFTPNPGRKPRERDKFFDWLHGKWHDTFCPVGPCLLDAKGVDPQTLKLTLKVNGETKQDATTAQMVFPVAAVISFISSFVTLEPGDVISTGTPSGVGSATGTYLKAGDVVEASIEGIGVLRNQVHANSDIRQDFPC